jgi:hypothetical protein
MDRRRIFGSWDIHAHAIANKSSCVEGEHCRNAFTLIKAADAWLRGLHQSPLVPYSGLGIRK